MDEIVSKFGEKSEEEGVILERMRKRKARKKLPTTFIKASKYHQPQLVSFSSF